MKSRLSWVRLMALIGVVAMGLGILGALAQGGMQGDPMEMMKQKMMNRPSAMKKADQSIQDQKQKAMRDGKYGCCLKHPCDHCALKMGECPCGMSAASGKPVCNECKGGWYAGDGVVPEKTADQIMTMPRMDMPMTK